jgi:hypothetical protein
MLGNDLESLSGTNWPITSPSLSRSPDIVASDVCMLVEVLQELSTI